MAITVQQLLDEIVKVPPHRREEVYVTLIHDGVEDIAIEAATFYDEEVLVIET
jgi:hypothetical protein